VKHKFFLLRAATAKTAAGESLIALKIYLVRTLRTAIKGLRMDQNPEHLGFITLI